MGVKTTAYRYPVFGPNREYKKAIEGYWKDKHDKKALLQKLDEIATERVKLLNDYDLDIVPSNDFFPYDFILDTAAMFGVVPDRFDWSGGKVDIDTYYGMARGTDEAVACEMTKWFDTNYHYIVPEISGEFTLTENKPLQSFRFAKKKAGIETRPVMIGPFTFLDLSKVYKSSSGQTLAHGEKATESEDFESLFLQLAELYNKVIKELEEEGVESIQLDEPSLVLDRSDKEIDLLIKAYQKLTEGLSDIKVYVQTYYESLSHYKKITNELPVNGIGLDLVSNEENLDNIKNEGFPEDKELLAGIIGGRDVWRTNFAKAKDWINTINKTLPLEQITLTNAAPLFHLPVSIEPERGHVDDQVLEFLAFANERLEELKSLRTIINEDKDLSDYTYPKSSETFKNEKVQSQVANIDENNIGRDTPFHERYEKQKAALDLPPFPSTTIGSYPQTKKVRKARSRFKKGKISGKEYKNFIQEQIREVIDMQEEIGLDVMVHGEFERSDMVEFFGQKMDGFAFTRKGWVQSYGTRGVRPPVIYGDVSRPEAMTVEEITYAQSLTDKPVKGMLTGPVTIVNWSFYRKDIPKKEIAYQIALALKEEVLDLEEAGIQIVQIDEPAFREGLPLKDRKQQDYLDWAVNAFKLTHDTVKDETMIQTHMCYSEFNEIIDAIQEMDADVLFIEASRSKGELLEVFEKYNYNHGIGPGVYDIHSPRVPDQEEIDAILDRATAVIDNSLIWVNPDCGLKTRKYKETVPALKNMVASTKKLRTQKATV